VAGARRSGDALVRQAAAPSAKPPARGRGVPALGARPGRPRASPPGPRPRPDAWLDDLARLSFVWWRGRPEAREAFLDGYGRVPDDTDLAIMVRSYALTLTWHRIWALTHGNPTFADGCRDLLRALMRDELPF
jgi:hypothetical protein